LLDTRAKRETGEKRAEVLKKQAELLAGTLGRAGDALPLVAELRAGAPGDLALLELEASIADKAGDHATALAAHHAPAAALPAADGIAHRLASASILAAHMNRGDAAVAEIDAVLAAAPGDVALARRAPEAAG